jgi:chloride channel protein, CIC family
VYAMLDTRSDMRRQRIIPVLSDGAELRGTVSWGDVLERAARGRLEGAVDEVMQTNVVTAFADESLRTTIDRMASRHVGELPVIDRGHPTQLLGLLTQDHLLRARERHLEEERHRERVLRVRPL